MAVKADISISAKARLTGSNALGTPNFDADIIESFQFLSGTGADHVDILYAAERTFLSSTADTLDLAGVLVNALGDTITAVEIVGLIIVNKSKAGVRNTVPLTIGAGTNPWISWLIATGDGVKVGPGGLLALIAPDASGLGTVTASTGDILTVTPGAAAGAYQIMILGRTA